MCLARFLQRINLVNIDFDLPRAEHAKELVGIMLEFLACRDVPK